MSSLPRFLLQRPTELPSAEPSNIPVTEGHPGQAGDSNEDETKESP
jgi:hypothetical protein